MARKLNDYTFFNSKTNPSYEKDSIKCFMPMG